MISTKAHPMEHIFIELYKTYANSMYKIAFSILKNQAQAEDIVQEAFIKLMRYLPELTDVHGYKAKGLISKITKNTAINKYRSNQMESRMFDRNAIPVESAHSSTTEVAENRHLIQQILMQLDKKSREIIEFRCFYELDYKEIAAILEISEQAAAKRYERAKKQVQLIIGDDCYV